MLHVNHRLQVYFPSRITYFLNFGSSASCKPSPNTLNANMVNEIKKAGKKSVHQCPDKMAPNESLAMTPQLAKGACMPKPIKLRSEERRVGKDCRSRC